MSRRRPQVGGIQALIIIVIVMIIVISIIVIIIFIMIIIVVIIFSLRFARLAPNPDEWDLSVGLVCHKENAVQHQQDTRYNSVEKGDYFTEYLVWTQKLRKQLL